MEKLVYALVISARKLKSYFECHTIEVVTSFPLGSILNKPDLAEMMALWAMELGAYNIKYIPRMAMKSQIPTDFVAEFTAGDEEVYVDRSSNVKGSGAGMLLRNPSGDLLEHSLRFRFAASNNEAEFKALIAGLGLAKTFDATSLKIFSDTQLVVNQVNGSYAEKDPTMAAYLQKVKELLVPFEKFKLKQLPREENSHADALANIASAVHSVGKRSIPVEFLEERSINCTICSSIEPEEDSWMTSIVRYIVDGVCPNDKFEARKLRMRVKILYVRGTTELEVLF